MASAADSLASGLNLSKFAQATDLKKRLWFTIGALIVFRLLSYVPLPGVDPTALGVLSNQTNGGVLDFFNNFSGGSLKRMARIAGVNIPTNKRVVIALQYIHGIGPAKAKEITTKLNIAPERRVQDLTDQEVLQIREAIDAGYMVEGDLRRETAMNIKRLMDLACYRGLRHRKGLPVRGQRTHTNARTRKGKAKPIAGKKK